jgi:hypothetical protein
MSTGIPPRNDRSQLKIYPVPASDQLIVDGLSSGRQNTRIAIFNSVGIMVLNNNASAFAAEEGRLDIPVSALPSGIYYVRLTSDQEVITRKIEIIGNR